MAIGLVVAVMFFAGGNEGSLNVAGEELGIPKFVEQFLSWNYILVALSVLVTLAAVVMVFIRTFKASPKRACISLGAILLLAALFVVCWFLGSDKELLIPGYDGTDNVGPWAQLSDMMIYITYILFGATLLTMLGGWIYTKTK